MERIVVFPSDLTGCGYYRLYQPFSIIQKHYEVHWNIAYNIFELYRWLDFKFKFLATQRQYEQHQLIAARTLNIPYVVDTDDLVWVDNPLSPFKLNAEQITVHDKILKLAKKLIVSTKPLQEEIKYRIGKEAVILPNLIQRKHLHPPRIQNRSPLRVLYAGSSTHVNDLKTFHGMIKKAATSGKYKFVFVGWVPDELKPYVEFHNWTTTDKYVPYLSTLDCDIGFIPLANNRFNRSKSHIKLLEFSAIGLPVIASKGEAYKENPNIPMEFNLLELLEMLSDPTIRKQWADNNYQFAQQYILEDWEDKILDAWCNF